MSGEIDIVVDGARIRTRDGMTVAAALLGAGHTAFRQSVTGEARAPLCGMGVCHECRVTINGVTHQRSCLVAVAANMQIETCTP